LRKALTKNQIRVLYQPIIYLPTEAGMPILEAGKR